MARDIITNAISGEILTITYDRVEPAYGDLWLKKLITAAAVSKFYYAARNRQAHGVACGGAACAADPHRRGSHRKPRYGAAF